MCYYNACKPLPTWPQLFLSTFHSVNIHTPPPLALFFIHLLFLSIFLRWGGVILVIAANMLGWVVRVIKEKDSSNVSFYVIQHVEVYFLSFTSPCIVWEESSPRRTRFSSILGLLILGSLNGTISDRFLCCFSLLVTLEKTIKRPKYQNATLALAYLFCAPALNSEPAV